MGTENSKTSFTGSPRVISFMEDSPILSMIFQWNEGGIEQAAVILFSSESLSANLGTGSTNVSFLINHQGDLLVHNDFNLVQAGTNYASLPLVQAMWENNDSSRQIMFSNTDGQQYFGAYNRLNLGDLGVITIIAADMVFEPIYANMLRNIYLTITILFLTVIFIYFFSKTITTPIRFLTAASNEIEQGHFLIELKPRTQDEIGLLTKRFVKMGQGLAERERLKDTFGRFINKDIAPELKIKNTDIRMSFCAYILKCCSFFGGGAVISVNSGQSKSV